jgi:Fur family peroxide stress response transcriptional regulator
MNTTTTKQRQTKYCQAIGRQLQSLGHATNAELLEHLNESFPNLSPTTVHRATTRLSSRGIIKLAPPKQDGSMRYDANTKAHDHFHCLSCDLLRDIDIKNKVIPILESNFDGCKISGQLIINGLCSQCAKS